MTDWTEKASEIVRDVCRRVPFGDAEDLIAARLELIHLEGVRDGIEQARVAIKSAP